MTDEPSFFMFHLFFADTLLDSEYLHLPDLRTLDGVLDLLSACSLIILRNVLDFQHIVHQTRVKTLKRKRCLLLKSV